MILTVTLSKSNSIRIQDILQLIFPFSIPWEQKQSHPWSMMTNDWLQQHSRIHGVLPHWLLQHLLMLSGSLSLSHTHTHSAKCLPWLWCQYLTFMDCSLLTSIQYLLSLRDETDYSVLYSSCNNGRYVVCWSKTRQLTSLPPSPFFCPLMVSLLYFGTSLAVWSTLAKNLHDDDDDSEQPCFTAWTIYYSVQTAMVSAIQGVKDAKEKRLTWMKPDQVYLGSGRAVLSFRTFMCTRDDWNCWTFVQTGRRLLFTIQYDSYYIVQIWLVSGVVNRILVCDRCRCPVSSLLKKLLPTFSTSFDLRRSIFDSWHTACFQRERTSTAQQSATIIIIRARNR